MLDYQWISVPVPEEKLKPIQTNASDLPAPLQKILAQRGLEDPLLRADFLNPSLEKLHDPFLLKDMEKAVARIQKTLAQGEKILVYGDYDVDGTTSVALVFQILSHFTSKIGYYIPDRYTEGYGISFQSIDHAEKEGFSLVIALDCGVKALEQIAYAKQKNIDFVVCDHHLPGDKLPEAVAVLDPKRADCSYPYKELSGCGVGFKLMQAFLTQENHDLGILWEKLDFVMVSIVCDIVEMLGENRILAYFGLKKFNENPSLGLKFLKQVAAYPHAYSATDIVFKIGPRINAAGRIKTGDQAVALLISEDPITALGWSQIVDESNELRKSIEKNMQQEAIVQLEADPFWQQAQTTVIFQEDWSKGIIGILASKLVERYYRPTLVLTQTGEKVAGSGRSVPGFDLYAGLEACSDLFLQFGGHQAAAGFTMEKAQIPALIQRFDQVVKAQMDPQLQKPTLAVEARLPFAYLKGENGQLPLFFHQMNALAPFGPGNFNPIFYSQCSILRLENLQNRHLKLYLYDPHSQLVLEAIGFDFWQKQKTLQADNWVEIIYTLDRNYFLGKERLQLMLKDIRLLTKT